MSMAQLERFEKGLGQGAGVEKRLERVVTPLI